MAPPGDSPAQAGARHPLKRRGLVRTRDRRDPEFFDRVFGFVRDHQAQLPVAAMCRVLGVSPSGFYAWRDRPMSRRAVRDVHLTAQITASHARSDGTYGAPRILHDLREAGERVGQTRIARLMRQAAARGRESPARSPDDAARTGRGHPRRIGSSATSPRRRRMHSGSRISRACAPGRAFSISRSCWMHSVAAWWGGPWRRTSRPS